ncbi:hypothetical protein F5Y17DRAFT_186182 [Xylariaceae sp. FL0594]|nr:hypothetical protein F5Y17DRAFT_186182 [Xylariaceae sp. FL0594]
MMLFHWSNVPYVVLVVTACTSTVSAEWWKGAPECAHDCLSSAYYEPDKATQAPWPKQTDYCGGGGDDGKGKGKGKGKRHGKDKDNDNDKGKKVGECISKACSATTTAYKSYSSLSSSLCAKYASCTKAGKTGPQTLTYAGGPVTWAAPGGWGGANKWGYGGGYDGAGGENKDGGKGGEGKGGENQNKNGGKGEEGQKGGDEKGGEKGDGKNGEDNKKGDGKGGEGGEDKNENENGENKNGEGEAEDHNNNYNNNNGKGGKEGGEEGGEKGGEKGGDGGISQWGNATAPTPTPSHNDDGDYNKNDYGNNKQWADWAAAYSSSKTWTGGEVVVTSGCDSFAGSPWYVGPDCGWNDLGGFNGWVGWGDGWTAGPTQTETVTVTTTDEQGHKATQTGLGTVAFAVSGSLTTSSIVGSVHVKETGSSSADNSGQTQTGAASSSAAVSKVLGLGLGMMVVVLGVGW